MLKNLSEFVPPPAWAIDRLGLGGICPAYARVSAAVWYGRRWRDALTRGSVTIHLGLDAAAIEYHDPRAAACELHAAWTAAVRGVRLADWVESLPPHATPVGVCGWWPGDRPADWAVCCVDMPHPTYQQLVTAHLLNDDMTALGAALDFLQEVDTPRPFAWLLERARELPLLGAELQIGGEETFKDAFRIGQVGARH